MLQLARREATSHTIGESFRLKVFENISRSFRGRRNRCRRIHLPLLQTSRDDRSHPYCYQSTEARVHTVPRNDDDDGHCPTDPSSADYRYGQANKDTRDFHDSDDVRDMNINADKDCNHRHEYPTVQMSTAGLLDHLVAAQTKSLAL